MGNSRHRPKIVLPGGGMTDHGKMVAAQMAGGAQQGPQVAGVIDVGATSWGPMKPVTVPDGEKGTKTLERVFVLTKRPFFDDEKATPGACEVFMPAFVERHQTGVLMPSTEEGLRPFICKGMELELDLAGQSNPIKVFYRAEHTTQRIAPQRVLEVNWVTRAPWMEVTQSHMIDFKEFVEEWWEEDPDHRGEIIEACNDDQSGAYEGLLELYLSAIAEIEGDLEVVGTEGEGLSGERIAETVETAKAIVVKETGGTAGMAEGVLDD